MLETSSEYQAAIMSLSRTDRLTGTLTRADGTVIDLSDGNVNEGSMSISWDCVSGEEIEFGSAIMAQLDFSIRTSESRYAFYDAKVVPVYGIQLEDGTWFDVPLGEYTVSEAERKNALVSLTAYDNLLFMDRDYGGTALYGTPFEIFKAICETCGLALATTEEEFLAMPNGDQLIQVDETSGCSTYRDCAKVVAQMIGAIVVADRSGAVAVKRYGKEKVITIPKRNRFSTAMADYICNYMGLRVISSSGEYRAYDPDQESGLEMTIQDTPAWDYGLEETLQARVDTLLGELTQIVYTPGNVSTPGNPALECGDMVELETDDGTVNTILTNVTWKYRGKMTLKSAGANPYLEKKVTRKTVVLRDLQNQTEENKLIFYSFTNQNAVSVSGQEPEQIAQVTFVTTKATSAMFIAQLPLVVECEDTVETDTTSNSVERTATVSVTTASGVAASAVDANGNPLTITVTVLDTDTDTVKTVTPGYVDVQVEYYLDGNLVDYELIHRCHAGGHILSLFYTFAALDGNANYQWQVKIKIVGGSGTVTVPKRGFRATVTGQGMAGTEAWDGTLSFDESVPPLSLTSRMTLVPVAEEVTTETQTPIPAGIEEIVSAFSMRSRMSLVGVSDEVDVNPVWEQQTVSADRLIAWDYQSRYVTRTETGVQLRISWNYQSAEQAIDQGRMTVVKAVTNDLASVESLEVDVSG